MEENTKIKNNFLPVGTVVKLKDEEKKVMIIGFSPMFQKTKKVYNYVACLYPEGIIDSKNLVMFDNNKIEKIYYKGLIDKESIEFEKKIEKYSKIFNNIEKYMHKKTTK